MKQIISKYSPRSSLILVNILFYFREVRRKLTGSTPNLANENTFAIPKESVEFKSHGNEPNKKAIEEKTIRYDRATLLTIAEGSCTEEKSQNAADEVKGAAPEILRIHE